MVRSKASRPPRRNAGAGPRRRDGPDDDEDAVPVVAVDRYPNMTARREMDRAEHVRRARAMGLTRKQASKHADEDLGGH